jgi:hypothetical protein
VFNGAAFLRWEVYIDNSNVTLNTATSNGGAVYADRDIHCAVVGSFVAENTAAYGGGAYIISNQFTSNSSVWRGNAAVAYGGAAYVDTVLYAAVNASTFQANTAGIGGGALFITATALAAVESNFAGNMAIGLTPRGGACYVRDGAGVVSFEQCVFANNSAVAVQSAQAGALQMVESFGANQGGALSFMASVAAVNVSFVRCTFNGNTAAAGGALAMPEAVQAVNATFTACTLRNNAATYQGGVFFLGNTTTLVVRNGSLIEANIADFGAVYASRLPYPAINIDASSVVRGNTPTNYGPLFATVPVVFLPNLTSPSTRTGAALSASVAMVDAYGQTVADWPDLKVSVALPTFVSDAFISGQASAITLTNGSLPFSFLKLNGVPNNYITLHFTAESPSLPSIKGNATLDVGILPCAFAEVFMPETLSCKCTERSRYDADVRGCVCAYSFYMDVTGVCGSCPSGAVCPGNNYPYAVAGFWRAPVNWTKFYQCEDELCLAMETDGEPAASNCREGHTGLLCTACMDGFTQQGQFCEACAPGSNFQEQPAGRRGGILLGFGMLALFMCVIVLLPLFPHAIERLEAAASSMLALAMARLGGERIAGMRKRAGGFKLEKISKAGECVRLVIDQVQIVSSFTATMRIPWPAVFFRIVGVTSVLNLNLIELPNTACMTQRTSFLTYFIGICIGLAAAILALAALWLGGRAVARRWLGSPPDVVAAFTTSCIQMFVSLLCFAYTPVAEATMAVFSCMRIEDRSFLTIELGEECYTPRHMRYYRAAVFFLVVYVFGIPFVLLRLLYHFKVPQTAALHQRNARLRVLVVHCFVHGLQQPADRAATAELTVDTISDDHIDCLYAALFRRECVFFRPADDISEPGAAKCDDAAPADPDVYLTGVAVDVDLNTITPLQRRPSVSVRLSALSERLSALFSGEEAAHTAALPVQQLQRAFKVEELLKWSEVHLLIPPLRWREDEIVGCVEALYSHLHCDSWFWEFAEILRKFVFACVVGFISRGSSGQVTAATFVSFIFLAIFQAVRPYSGRRTNMVAFYSYASLLAYFYIALMLKVSVRVADSTNADALVFSALVGALTVGVFAAPIVAFAGTLHRLRYKKLNKTD